MNLPAQLAKHFREVHFGGNWTSVNLKDTLAGVSWQEATAKIPSFNTIAALVFHINYYVAAIREVLEGRPLNASDKFSFDLSPIHSQQDWEALLTKVWTDAEAFAGLVEQLPESKLREPFAGEKYGNFHRNLLGVIEHTHYHLGQIVLLKKMLLQTNKA